jgi:hypothetical protein
MSKYLSKAASKRVPLNAKRAGKGYYKGKGGTKEGHLTSKARFIVDPKSRLELMVPDLEGFKVCTSWWFEIVQSRLRCSQFFNILLYYQLKPYVASTASRFAPEIRRRPGQTL